MAMRTVLSWNTAAATATAAIATQTNASRSIREEATARHAAGGYESLVYRCRRSPENHSPMSGGRSMGPQEGSALHAFLRVRPTNFYFALGISRSAAAVVEGWANYPSGTRGNRTAGTFRFAQETLKLIVTFLAAREGRLRHGHARLWQGRAPRRRE